MKDFIKSLSEKLWFKPAMFCALALISVAICYLLQHFVLDLSKGTITADTVNKLLTVISGSMLTVATFAVGAMISAYASAASSATPRSFALILSDDTSQNAFSSFIGAFIFSVIGLIAVQTDLFEASGVFLLFILTLFIFAWVIVTFIFWVDQIARLGQIETAIDKTYNAAKSAIKRRRAEPYLQCQPYTTRPRTAGTKIYATEYGFVQDINLPKLQTIAKELDADIAIEILPGDLVAPGIVVATIHRAEKMLDNNARLLNAIRIGRMRRFENDPENGFMVLSEIAGKALSPGVNDPGTALNVIDVMVGLFLDWHAPRDKDQKIDVNYDRLYAKQIPNEKLFRSAFESIIRFGQGDILVHRKLLVAFKVLKTIDDVEVHLLVNRMIQLTQNYAEHGMSIDLEKSEIKEITKQLQMF